MEGVFCGASKLGNESEFDVVEAVEGPLYEITEQEVEKSTEGDEE